MLVAERLVYSDSTTQATKASFKAINEVSIMSHSLFLLIGIFLELLIPVSENSLVSLTLSFENVPALSFQKLNVAANEEPGRKTETHCDFLEKNYMQNVSKVGGTAMHVKQSQDLGISFKPIFRGCSE